jgi:biopolymer transport protein TolR
VLLALAGGIAVAQTQSADGGLRIGIVNTDEFLHLAKEALTISVLRDGKVFIQSAEIPPSELAMKLRAILNAGRNGPVYVRADKSVEYGTVMGVIAQVGASGFKKIMLVTVPPPR